MNESLICSPGFKFLYLSTKMGRFLSILSNLPFIFLNLLGLPLQFIYQVVFYDWQRCCGIMSQSLHHCNTLGQNYAEQCGQHYNYTVSLSLEGEGGKEKKTENMLRVTFRCVKNTTEVRPTTSAFFPVLFYSPRSGGIKLFSSMCCRTSLM